MLIAGLGNPGPAYRSSRHNVGFRVADVFAEKAGIRYASERWRGITGSVTINGKSITVLKPLTYMNLSGLSVRLALDGLGLGPRDLLVVHDDMDLDTGKLRIRLQGSSGGHRGVQSIIDNLGTGEFARLKIGVGRPPEGMDPVDYVLEALPPAEEEIIAGTVGSAADAILAIIHEGYERAMAGFNS